MPLCTAAKPLCMPMSCCLATVNTTMRAATVADVANLPPSVEFSGGHAAFMGCYEFESYGELGSDGEQTAVCVGPRNAAGTVLRVTPAPRAACPREQRLCTRMHACMRGPQPGGAHLELIFRLRDVTCVVVVFVGAGALAAAAGAGMRWPRRASSCTLRASTG